jgi:hypothetical protein
MSVQGESGNAFLTDDIIVRELMEALISSCVAVKRVHRDLENRFAKVGDVISVERPFMTKTSEGKHLNIQPMTDQKVPFKITRQRNFGLKFSQRDRTLTIDNFRTKYLNTGITQLGNDIEQAVLQCAVKKTYFGFGSPGVALNSDIVSDIDGRMTEVAIPEDGMRTGIINVRDGKNIDKEMKGKFNPEMVKGAIQRGYLGPISEMQLYRSAMMPVHTVGQWGGTPLINGSGQKGNLLNIDGCTVSKTGFLNEGDRFVIPGVYEVHPQTKQNTGELQRFVVMERVDTTASGTAQIKFAPSINEGSLTTINAEGVTVSLSAYQNVTNAPADNAQILIEGVAGASYRQNIFYHRNAYTLCMVEKELPETAPVKARVSDPETGLSLSMTAAYDIMEDEQIYRVDCVFGVDALQQELAFRQYSSLVA